jgi:hypothetical protein
MVADSVLAGRFAELPADVVAALNAHLRQQPCVAADWAGAVVDLRQQIKLIYWESLDQEPYRGREALSPIDAPVLTERTPLRTYVVLVLFAVAMLAALYYGVQFLPPPPGPGEQVEREIAAIERKDAARKYEDLRNELQAERSRLATDKKAMAGDWLNPVSKVERISLVEKKLAILDSFLAKDLRRVDIMQAYAEAESTRNRLDHIDAEREELKRQHDFEATYQQSIEELKRRREFYSK